MTVPRCVATAFGFAAFVLSVPACGGEDETPTPRTDEENVARAANAWAELFAAGDDKAACRYEGQPLCEEMDCRDQGEPIENCVPPPLSYRKSFTQATVKEVAVVGENAGVKFSNGATVAFNGGEPNPREWYVSRLRGDAGKQYFVEAKIVKTGNEWAALFAKGNGHTCDYMTQPACEREVCRHVSGLRIKNCEPPTEAYRRSFEGATVEDVAIAGASAGARFSNGETAEILPAGVPGVPYGWWITRWGRHAGRWYFEQ
jgi:hypothetical protein